MIRLKLPLTCRRRAAPPGGRRICAISRQLAQLRVLARPAGRRARLPGIHRRPTGAARSGRAARSPARPARSAARAPSAAPGRRRRASRAAGDRTVDTVAAACMASNGALNAGLTPARRLTRDQFNNTVRDLLGATGTPADALGARREDRPVQQQRDRARRRHAGAAAPGDGGVAGRRRQGAHGADLAVRSEQRHRHQHHLRDALRDRVRQARLPPPARRLRDPAYVALYTLGKQGDGAANGFRLVVEAMLQSPFFLYHHDVGATGTPQAGTVGDHALRAGVAAVVLPLEHDARRHAVRARRATGRWPPTRSLTGEVQRMLASDKAAGDDRALPPPVARRHRAASTRPRTPTVYPALQRRARRRDDAGAGDVLGLRRAQGRRSAEDAADVEPRLPAGRPVRPLRRRAAGRLQGRRSGHAGRQPARRHPDAGGVPDPLGARQPDVARSPRQAGAPQRDVRLRPAAAR